MAEEVGALRVGVRANSVEIADDLGKVRNIINNWSNQTSRMMNNFGKNANKAVGEIFNMRTAVAGLAGGAFIALVKRSLDYADSLGETADAIGVSTQALQEQRYAFQINGVAAEQFDKAMLFLTKGIGEAATQTNNTSKALGKLGITMEQIKGMTPDQVVKLIASSMANLTDKSAQATIAADLFGKRVGQRMIPTLIQGATYLDKMAAEAHRLGLVLSEDTLKKASDANDEFDRMAGALKVAGVNASVALLPALTEMRKLFTSPEFQKGVADAAASFGKLITWMVENKSTVLQLLAAFSGAKLGAAFGPVGAIIGGVTGAVVAGVKTQITEINQLEMAIKLASTELDRLGGQLATSNDPVAIQKIAGRIAQLQIELKESRDKLADLKKEAAQPVRTEVVVVGNKPEFFSPEVKQQIDDLRFNTRVLQGDFDQMAKGFPEAARGLKVFGTTAENTTTSLSGLPKQLQEWNDAMLTSQAAKIIDGLKTGTQKYEEELGRLNQLHDAGKLSADQYAQAVASIQFPSLTKAIDDATNLQKQLDGFSTRAVDSTADALTDIVTGAKDGKEAFEELAKSVIRDLIQMTIKMLIFRAISSFILPFAEGGDVGGGLIPRLAQGGAINATGGGQLSGPGTGTSDSILAWLSDKEFVVRADQAQKYGDLLRAINNDDVPQFSGGGPVSPLGASAFPNMQRSMEITLIGDNFSKETVIKLIKKMNQAVDDGVPLKASVVKK